MDNKELIAEARGLPDAWPNNVEYNGQLELVAARLVRQLADALEAAEAGQDRAWADGYNKAISQRLAASGSIEGNF